MRPASATSNIINLTGVAGFFCAIWVSHHYALSNVNAALLCGATYGFVILLLEVLFLKTPKRASTGLDFSRYDFNLKRVAIKLVGVYGSLGFVALLYWLFPEYHGSFYDPYWEAIKKISTYVLVLIVPYTVFVDCRMKAPEDTYYHLGRLILMHGTPPHWNDMVQHLLGWVIKGYFLPLMWVAFTGNMGGLTNPNIYNIENFTRFFQATTSILFSLDLIAAVVGYSLALRLFDTHFRSAEPTLKGWLVCIICYQPFMSIVMTYYLAYTSIRAIDVFASTPIFQIIWGSVALVFLLGYAYASTNFGCRFSNLTHRGVLTNGMYGLTKHPAYVCKNIYWWMVHIPFFPINGGAEALRYSILLLGVNIIYYIRAKTEEAHLSRDPAYVEYALYMNDHSILRGLAKYIPQLKYKAPTLSS